MSQAANLRPPILPLKELETPAWSELGMADWMKLESDVAVPVCDNPPCQVLDHAVIFVLSCAIICMEEYVFLS